EDLFYRLNVIQLVIPPLRERPKDIQPLVEHLLTQIATVHGKKPRKFSAAAVEALRQHAFPGNVRELRNLVERVTVTGPRSGQIQVEDLPAHIAQSKGDKLTLEQLEKAYIAEILDHARGKKSKAAAILGISRKTLLEKRKRYRLD